MTGQIPDLRSESHRPRLCLAALCTLIAAAVLIAGCGPGGEPAPADRQARFLSLGTAPPGGAFFLVGSALADVLDRHHRAEGWRVNTEATKGSQENLRRLERGELDLALSNSAITYFAVRGGGAWEQPTSTRALLTLAPNVAFFVAPRSAGIASIADLRGRRVVIGPAGAGFEAFVGPILEAHGLAYDDLDVLHAPQAAAVDMLADGSVAAAFLGGAVPTPSIEQAASTQDLVFIPFDPAVRDSLIERYSFFRPAVVPAGTYAGQDDELAVLDVGSMHLVAAAALDDDTAYQVVRTLYENRAEVAERHPAGRAINPGNVVRDTGTEFHPGAVRYYREIGIWPDSEDSRQEGAVASP